VNDQLGRACSHLRENVHVLKETRTETECFFVSLNLMVSIVAYADSGDTVSMAGGWLVVSVTVAQANVLKPGTVAVLLS
jgi:hypothetical protein